MTPAPAVPTSTPSLAPSMTAPQPAAPPAMIVAPAEAAEYLISSNTVPAGVARGLAILDLDLVGTGQPVAVSFFAI